MKLYGISGLGADKRVFQYLTLNCEFLPIDWMDPHDNESIEDYSLRLSAVINKDEKYGLLGVSFGGIVAIEISKKLNPELTILISSAETREDLKGIYKAVGKTNILNLFPDKFFDVPRGLAYMMFGTDNKELLRKILDDTDLRFTKWAINQLINWQNTQRLNNCLKISGTKDKLIPPQKGSDVRLIKGGEHFMIVDRAKEISEIINEYL